MIQWAATVCCWILLGLLVLTDYAKWAVIIAGSFAAAVLVIVIGFGIAGHVRRLRYARDTDQAVAVVSKIPGPDHPQASGIGPGEDTGVTRWSEAEQAYLRGETNTLPATSDIPEENPS